MPDITVTVELAKLEEAYTTICYHLARRGAASQAEIDNLKDSGPRIARGLLEMVWTSEEVRQELKAALETLFPVQRQLSASARPIMVGPIDTHSLCPHHLLPIVNVVSIGYVPEEQVLGLSKIPRIAIALAHRAVVQEQYTADIARVLTTGYYGAYRIVEKPLSSSVAVNVRAVHHCMICRGVRGRALTESEELTGTFRSPVSTEYQMFSRFLRQQE